MDARVEGSGNASTRTVPRFEDALMGVPVVLLDAVTEEFNPETGEVISRVIPDMDGLIAAMAITRITSARKLNGADIRFPRKALGMPAKDLGDVLEVAPETISRWENGKDAIGPSSEKLLRMLVGMHLHEKAPAVDFDQEQVMAMKIETVQFAGEIEPMIFHRVKLKVPPKKTEPHWEIQELIAA